MTIEIKINDSVKVIDPRDNEFLAKELADLARSDPEIPNLTFTHRALLRNWLEDQTACHNFASFKELLQALCAEASKNKQVPGEIRTISAEDLKIAKKRRKLMRIGTVYTQYKNNIGAIAPGINNLEPGQLVPLDHYNEQRDRWLRTSNGTYVQVKPRINGDAEAEVSAFGKPEDPSLLVYRDNRQLGHRVKGIPNDDGIYADNDSDDRTYGNKRLLEGSVYKMPGMVDGHSIQAQNNQRNLDKSSPYETADQHPHNMYWENAAYGKFVRQKGFENAVFMNETEFVHVNQYEDYENPTRHEASNGKSYIVADRVHNLIIATDGTQTYASFNNSRLADYGNLTYRKEHDDYDIAEKLTPGLNARIKTENGGNADEHIEANKKPVDEFPGAQIIDMSAADFDYIPSFRGLDPGYASPPASPTFVSVTVEQGVKIKKQFCFDGEKLSDNTFIGAIAAYDSKSEEHTLTVCQTNCLSPQMIKDAIANETAKENNVSRKNKDKVSPCFFAEDARRRFNSDNRKGCKNRHAFLKGIKKIKREQNPDEATTAVAMIKASPG